ncbi:hypothetical protein [Streptomyces rochei]|uniref:hypothetical protein n=1 Tax=Streptomyces rochei TaxID=1928 RepID=UPI0036C60F1F
MFIAVERLGPRWTVKADALPVPQHSIDTAAHDVVIRLVRARQICPDSTVDPIYFVLYDVDSESRARELAAALVHTLGCCRWLERSNMAVAAASGVMYLEAAGISAKPDRKDAVAYKDLLLDPACTAGKIAALLRTWPTAT